MHKVGTRPKGGSAAAKAELRPGWLDDGWRRWIAENLLVGTNVAELRAALEARGCPPGVAAAEVMRAAQSPYLQGATILQSRIAKRDWLLESYGRLAALDGGLAEVPVRRALDPAEFFRDYYAMHRPVLLQGMIDHWPAMRTWSLDHVEAVLGDVQVQVQTQRESDPDYESQSLLHRAPMRLPEFIRILRQDTATNDVYLTANNNSANRAVLAPLWEEVGDLPGILSPAANAEGFFWMGPKGSVTPFHHDLTNNLLIQIVGRKKVWLVPSWETPRMANYQHCFSRHAGPAAIAALPAEARPAMIECVIEPGEILFLPVGWWHHVEGLDVTIGLSFTQFVRDNDFYSRYTTTGAL